MPVILLAIFIDLVGFGMILPILPFIAQTYGGDSITIAGIMSIYAFTAFTIGPIWGKLSDRIGRKPALAITFLGAALAYLMLALSTSLWMIFVARAISGAMSGNIGIVMASMADITDDSNRGKAMGRIGAAFGLGFAFGPGIGGYLSTVGGETSIFWPGLAASVLSLIALILTAIYVKETNPNKSKNTADNIDASLPEIGQQSEFPTQSEPQKTKSQWREIISGPERAPLFAMFIIAAIGQSISFLIVPLWLDTTLGWTAREVGFLMMTAGVFVFIQQLWTVGPMFKAFGEVKSLQYCAVVHITGCLIIIFGPPSSITAIIGFPLVLGALAMSYPALNSLLSQRTQKERQGAALGLSNGFGALGRVMGPLIGGLLFSATATYLPFVVVISIGLIAFAWTWWESRRRPHLNTKQAAQKPTS